MPEAALRTKLTGDSAEFQRSLREGIDSAKEFADAFKDTIRETLVEVTGLVLGVESLKEAFDKTFEGVKGVFDLSRDLRNLSNQTGASVRELVQLRAQFDLSGMSADSVGGILNRMQRSIEQASDKGGPLADVFYRIGLNLDDLQSMDAAQQFEALREKLSAIEDPARRAQIAMKLFGNFGGGGSVLSIFGNAKIAKEASEAISEQADILARNASTFQEVSINMEEAGIRLEGFYVGMAEPISRVILPILEELNSLDLAKWGEEIGGGIANAVRILYNAFENNQLGNVLGESVKFAFAEGVNYLIGAAQIFGEAVTDIMTTLNSSQFGLAMYDLLIGAADAFIGEMMKVLQPFSDGLRALFNDNLNSFFEGFKSLLAQVPGMGEIASRFNTDTGPRTAEGVRNARIAAYRQAQLDAAGLGSFDPNGPGPSAAQQKQINAINSSNFDPGSTIGGATSDMFQGAGAQFLLKGAAEMKAPLTDLVSQIAALKFNPANVLNADQYKNQLTDLLKNFTGNIPGEGTSNTPEKKSGGGGQDDFSGFGRGENITGIHHGAGGWQGVYDWSAGPVNIETGMAGRAGRVVSGPQTIEQNTASTASTLDKIHTQLSNITAPS